MKIGDVSRQRRFADPIRQRWYAHHRAVRFALRMRQSCLPLETAFLGDRSKTLVKSLG